MDYTICEKAVEAAKGGNSYTASLLNHFPNDFSPNRVVITNDILEKYKNIGCNFIDTWIDLLTNTNSYVKVKFDTVKNNKNLFLDVAKNTFDKKIIVNEKTDYNFNNYGDLSVFNKDEAKLELQKSLYSDETLKLLNKFSSCSNNSFDEAISLISFFKESIEKKGVWKEFWINDSDRINENSVQNLFKLTWKSSKFHITAEANNGSGPVDFVISMGGDDITVIEFKLASNSNNTPINQLESYKKAQGTDKGLIVVFCFDEGELISINKKITDNNYTNIIVISIIPQLSASKQHTHAKNSTI